MKIILAHNFYSSDQPSGESEVVAAEKELLERRGHQVISYFRYSDELNLLGSYGKVKGGIVTPWSYATKKAIKTLVEEEKPDIVHAHNTFPLMSPSLFHGAHDRAATILTLHNYRIYCPAAIPSRSGKVCTECLDKRNPLPALLHGCYRNSRIASIPLAAKVALHRAIGTWQRKVDAFIVLSDFQRELMIEAGLPRRKVFVKPNFYAGTPEVTQWSEREDTVVYAGRLSREKGIHTLLEAWKLWGKKAPQLKIIGDGPLYQDVVNFSRDLNISVLGRLSHSDTVSEIAKAKLQVLPSEWFEGFPMVVREAFAFGTPSAVSRIGPLPTIVTHKSNGIVFEPGDKLSLYNSLSEAWSNDTNLAELGKAARTEFEKKYTEVSNYDILQNIYDEVLRARKYEH